jgi:4-carboxymuconolactone decarboxylase
MSERLPTFHLEEANEAQKIVLHDIVSGPRGSLNGPFLTWIHSPELASKAESLGVFCRYHTGLPVRLSELAILVTAERWKAQAEWHIHYPIALASGLSVEIADAIRNGLEPKFDNFDEELIYKFSRQLYDSQRISNEIYDRVVVRWGYQTIINLVGLLGYYAMVAMTLNVFGVRAEGQSDLPFSEPQ